MSSYYVYALIDPRNNQPFYVGKGHGSRARTHLYDMSKVKNQFKENKIAAIRQDGLEPIVQYLVVDIPEESLAYDIESLYIKYYGRKGYEPNGILTNICTDSRPPNHKGKTYEEIYGTDRAKEQKEMRARLQRERGGYGPKSHTDTTKNLISQKCTGKKYGPCSESRKQKIGQANKKYVGENNKKSIVWKLTSPDGTEHTTVGNVDKLCKSLGLPPSTIHKMLYSKDNYQPSGGPAKGWKVESFKRSDNTQS